MNTEEKIYHLNAMANAMMEVENYVANMDFNDFVQAEESKRIIGMNFQLIGEEAFLIKDEVKEEFANFDFEVLTNLSRFNDDLEQEMDLHPAWNIVKNDIPEIREQINELSEKLTSRTEIW